MYQMKGDRLAKHVCKYFTYFNDYLHFHLLDSPPNCCDLLVVGVVSQKCRVSVLFSEFCLFDLL